MSILKGAALVGQSGGPTAAINATLAGVIKGAIENPEAITKLYGMRNGIEGFMKETICDLSEIFAKECGVSDEEKLSLLAATPAAALGSCRKKLPKHTDDPSFMRILFPFLRSMILDISSISAEMTLWIR